MLRKTLALVLVSALVTSGCASASGGRIPAAAPPVVDAAAMAEYVQKIPSGSRVKVERTNGDSMRATLMKTTASAIVVQRNTRVPEPPVEIPIAEVARLTIDHGTGTSVAKSIGIGIAAGAGTFFALIALAFAISD
jgi:hypothetical protein